MALLNPPQTLPHAIRVVVEAIHSSKDPQSPEDLARLLFPASAELVSGDKRLTTISMAKVLGFVGTDPAVGSLSITERGQNAIKNAKSKGWESILRDATLEVAPAELSFQRHGESDDAWTMGSRDFLRAVTWFLAQSAYGPEYTWNRVQYLQQDQFGGDREDWPIMNDTRYGAFRRWILATGLASEWPNGLRPIPINAVRDTLPMISIRSSSRDFIQELSRLLPFLWGGTYREGLLRRIGSDPDPDVVASGIDSGVAITLLALEAEGAIYLEDLADATRKLVLCPSAQGKITVSHVGVNK
ncbi:protein DpdG [Lolliginicoccus suaedae]|uniref:protein DpdG n=1 Tax=Lolliginicoccus suaedae TaxID=2605429 RepID=UPI0011EDE403|nr:protein DpdG [Lolliginicoccus suaedae]